MEKVVFAQPAGKIYPNEPMPVPVSWGMIFDDPMVAAAMLDRLLHKSVVFNIDGASYRMRTHRARSERLGLARTHDSHGARTHPLIWPRTHTPGMTTRPSMTSMRRSVVIERSTSTARASRENSSTMLGSVSRR